MQIISTSDLARAGTLTLYRKLNKGPVLVAQKTRGGKKKQKEFSEPFAVILLYPPSEHDIKLVTDGLDKITYP